MASPKFLYRLLVRLYPARFREEYGSSLERQFLDDYRDARRARARSRFWLRTVWDLATSIPVEFVRELRQDATYSIRVYRSRSAVTVLALSALAITIGATTGVFSVVNALLLRSLPFEDPETLVELLWTPASNRAELNDVRTRSAYLSDLAMFSPLEMNLSVTGGAFRVKAAETSADFFSMFGAEPEFGRSFSPDEDQRGRGSVAVVGYGLWQQAFGGDTAILGATVRLNGAPLTVIGVAPLGFDYPEKTEIWTPTVFDSTLIPKRGAIGGAKVGRLRPGISVAQAREMFDIEMQDVNERWRRANVDRRAQMIPLRDRLAGPVRQASTVLLGAVGFVLLIACANVAQLLLSRVSGRHQELAIRAVLGASRARLVQQLVVEATFLTLASAAAGLVVARWAARVAAAVQPPPLATQDYNILDWSVLGFTMALAILTGIIFGVLPALILGRMQPGQELIRSQPGGTRSGASRMRIGLIAMQSALAIVLLAGSFTMGRAFLRLLNTDMGFIPGNVITLNVSLVGTPYETGEMERQYYTRALEGLRAIPGVEAAGLVSTLPLVTRSVADQSATPGYFRAIGADIVAGRDFIEADLLAPEPVVIVNEEYARQKGVATPAEILGSTFLRGKQPVGTIVGVIETIRSRGPGLSGQPEYYLSHRQGVAGFMSFVVRVRGNTEPYLAVCRAVLQQVDRGVPVYDVKTFEDRLREALAIPRFYTSAVLFLAGLALLVAVTGVYGAAAYSIGQRAHEIGVRAAVGASIGTLRSMLMREGLWPIFAGTAVGLIATTKLERFLPYLVATAEPLTFWAYLAAAGLLLAAAALAIWRATERIAKLDPISALRSE